MSVILAVDAIGANVAAIPRGMQSAGYTTGTGPVPWTQAQWDAHPGAVRICQDPGATDKTADVLDVESGAATTGDCPGWARAALGSYQSGARPGQRTPAVYMSASQVTPVVNALIAGGVKSGVSLWVANWNLTEPQAAADVATAAGPFPVIGVQYHSGAALDYDAFSAAWLQNVSATQEPPPPRGPYRHEIRNGNTYSFTRWAEDLRNESRSTLLAYNKSVTPGHLSQAHYDLLAALAACDGAAEAAKVTRCAMEPGTVIYTQKP